MKLIINYKKSYNHYGCTENEIYEIIKSSLKELNNLYDKVDEISQITDEQKNSLYNIIDIFWNVELSKSNKEKVEVSQNE